VLACITSGDDGVARGGDDPVDDQVPVRRAGDDHITHSHRAGRQTEADLVTLPEGGAHAAAAHAVPEGRVGAGVGRRKRHGNDAMMPAGAAGSQDFPSRVNRLRVEPGVEV
jgi:hypothetical protein